MTATLPFDLEQHRGFLFGLAYRMMGTAADAEDIVQDTFVRALAASPDGIERPRNYLATIATRLGLDRLKAARAKRETYVGPWLPEPLPNEPADPRAGPDDAVVLEDSISIAFLVVLESLTPAERAAFVLHDVFAFEYGEIASILGRTESTCRQHVHRARERLGQRRRRFAASSEMREQLTSAFLAAARTGDVAALASLLADDVSLRSDGGGLVPAATRPILGHERVLRFLLAPKYTRYQEEFTFIHVNGQPGLAVCWRGHLHSVILFEPTHDGRAGEILIVRNPEKLAPVAAAIGRKVVPKGTELRPGGYT